MGVGHGQDLHLGRFGGPNAGQRILNDQTGICCQWGMALLPIQAG
jgi:hypothetical protein